LSLSLSLSFFFCRLPFVVCLLSFVFVVNFYSM
jgi:hypothetical protein